MAQSKPARTRLYWMDALRGLAVILIAFNHSFDFPRQFGFDFRFEGRQILFGSLEPYRVPLLMVLSGLLLLPSLKKPLDTYLWGKVSRILWPYLVWGALTAVTVVDQVDLFNINYWRSGPLHLWFLAVLLGVYLVAPLVRFIPAAVLALIGPLTLLLIGETDQDIRFFLFWSFFFFIGVALAPHLTRLQQLGVWFPIVMGAAAIVFAYASVTRFILVLPDYPLGVFASLPGLAFLLWLAPRLPRLPFLELVGRHSIVMFCAHPVSMLLAARALAAWDIVLPPAVSWLIIAVFTFGFPLLLTYAYRYMYWLFELPVRIEQLRRLFTRPKSAA